MNCDITYITNVIDYSADKCIDYLEMSKNQELKYTLLYPKPELGIYGFG